jgi:glutathione synthase/RimK-type ligase-like ATP-grasp enzyme
MRPTLAPPPLAVALYQEAAHRLGFTTRILDPEFGFLWELEDRRGVRRTICGAKVPINDAAATQISGDKHYGGIVLERAGFRVPSTARCLSPAAFGHGEYAARCGPAPALEFAREQGYPLIVKPNRLSHGRGVQRVTDEASMVAAIETVFAADDIALVQTFATGREFRLDLLDGEFLVGYEREPLVARGDGVRTVAELLAACDPRYGDPVESAVRLAEVERSTLLAERAAGGLGTVLPAGTELDFSGGVMNLNRCATARVIDALPPVWADWCRRVAETMHLRHIGIDLRVASLDANPSEAVILETNSAPLVNQIAHMGHRERAIESLVRVLRALTEPSPLPPLTLG